MSIHVHLRKWLPCALCCIPVVAVAILMVIGFIVGGTAVGSGSDAWGLELLALVMLLCPLHMGWMLWRMKR